MYLLEYDSLRGAAASFHSSARSSVIHAKGLQVRLTVLTGMPCLPVSGLALLGRRAMLAGIRAPKGVQLRSCMVAACCTFCFTAVLPADTDE